MSGNSSESTKGNPNNGASTPTKIIKRGATVPAKPKPKPSGK